MAKTGPKSRKPAAVTDAPSKPLGGGAAPSPEPILPKSDDAMKTPRLGVPHTDQGVILFDQMREASRARLRELLTKPENLRALGLVQANADESTFQPELIGVLYDALGMVAMNIARVSGYSREDAAILAFSADEKNALIPVTHPVLVKYGSALGKWDKEVVLIAALGSILAGKVMQLRKTATVHPFPSEVVEPPASPTESTLQ